MTTTFKDLSSIDVTSHLEEKQGLNYLQWMAAWAIVKDYDSTATYEVLCADSGAPYFNDPVTGAFVKVAVTIKGFRLIEVLPILDYRNKPVIGDKLNSFDINTAIKRCLVKCLAMHGLGAQVYIDGEGHPLDLSKGLAKRGSKPVKAEVPFTSPVGQRRTFTRKGN